MGNNGARQVPSPASADSALSVGATNDQGSINRDDDSIASYSNYGPREDDGDDNPWDELKPDVVAPGTNILAPRSFVEGPFTVPGSSTLADDSYHELTGTSMATPHVAGMVAIILEKFKDQFYDEDDRIQALLVKDFVRNNTVLPEFQKVYKLFP